MKMDNFVKLFSRFVIAFVSCFVLSAYAQNAVTPAYYVTDSLVAMYDGIYNATNSTGDLVHDPAATKWLDLSDSGRDFILTSKGSWSENAFEFNGISAELSPALPYYRTQEIRCQVDSGRWVFLGSGFNGRILQGLVTASGSLDQFQTSFTYPKSSVKWLDASGLAAPFTTTAVYAESAVGSKAHYCNATATADDYVGSNEWDFDKISVIGGHPTLSSYTSVGRIQSIRLYSRELTAEEVALNYLVDQVRFEGAALPEPLEAEIEGAQLDGRAGAGAALLTCSVSSFGWLASSLDSAQIEYSTSADFASFSTVEVPVSGDGSGAEGTVGSLVPGGTYYARFRVVNDKGAETVGEVFSFTAQTEASDAPYVTFLAAEEEGNVATLDAALEYIPQGQACQLRAIVTNADGVYTNFLAAITQEGLYTFTLTHLDLESEYNIELLATCGESSYKSSAISIATRSLQIPLKAYAQEGLILHVDGIYNAVDEDGNPAKDPGSIEWADLTGNYEFTTMGTGALTTHDGTCYIFPNSQRYLEIADAPAISDAVLSGVFTIEAAAQLVGVAHSLINKAYGLYSVGSGNSGAPRTLCFDFRNTNNSNPARRGCIQYNASSWVEASRLAAYTGNDFLQASTLTVVGGGAVGSNARFWHSGNSVLDVRNNKKYTTASNIAKKFRIRYYDSNHAVTKCHAFRIYNRCLSDEEVVRNSTIDDVRFRGAELPASLLPEVLITCLDNGEEGCILTKWDITSFGWCSADIDSISLQYSLTPDFADSTEVQLAANVSESGELVIDDLEPGAKYYARVSVKNTLGFLSFVNGIEFIASSGQSDVPIFTTGDITSNTPGDSTFDISVLMDGGSACSGYVVLEADGVTVTNELFSGITGSYSASLALPQLIPGADYTATFYVTNATGAVAESVTRTFTTSEEDVFVIPYIEEGLIGLFDAKANAFDENGKPIHVLSVGTNGWVDLMGNFETTYSGMISATEDAISYAGSAYTHCNSAELAVDAILSGRFTVETLCKFASADTGSWWGIFSFGSGTSYNPRALCFDTRSNQGALQYNCGGTWYDDTVLFDSFDFSVRNTYTVVGGGTQFTDGAFYVNAEYSKPAINHCCDTPATAVSKKFRIHNYDGNSGATDYHSFRIYNRVLTEDEIAANRIADEVRYQGRDASLEITSFTLADNILTMTLQREGCDIPADIYAAAIVEYGDETMQASGFRFEKGQSVATVSIPVEAGTAYVRVKAGGLVSALKYVYASAFDSADEVTVAGQKVTAVDAQAATMQVAVLLPAGAEAVELYAAYGYQPDALLFTNALAVAEEVAQSSFVEGKLPGLRSERTYYISVFAKRGETVVSAASPVTSFTTLPETSFDNPSLAVTAVNRVDGRISSLEVQAAAGIKEVWLYGDAFDRGFVSEDWAYAAKVADVPEEGGTFTIAMPETWGGDIRAVRLATGTAVEAESLTFVASAGGDVIDTGLMLTGAASIEIDAKYDATTKQMILFSLGSSSSLTYRSYINGSGYYAYAWNVGDGNWVSTEITADTERHLFVFDACNARWSVDSTAANMKHSSSVAPYEVAADKSLTLFGVANSSVAGTITMWNARVTDGDGVTLLGDFVPALSGDEACLYDRVSHRAYLPTGGTLSAVAKAEPGKAQLVNPTAVYVYSDGTEVELGAEVEVTGHESGTSLTFSGTVSNAQSVNVNGYEAQLNEDGTWEVTISEGIEPGVPYECFVTALSETGADVLPVFTETTASASALNYNKSASGDQRTITFSGSIATFGANDSTVRLLTGPSANALTNTLSLVRAQGDDADFEFVWRAPAFDEPVYWTFAIENSVDQWYWASTNEVSSITPIDSSVYTWCAVDGDWNGCWSDTAHWQSSSPEDNCGYPYRSTAGAFIPQGTVEVDETVAIKDVSFGNDGPIVLTGSQELSIAARNASGGWELLPHGADVTVTGGLTLKMPVMFELCATNSAQTEYSASLTIADGANFSCTQLEMTHNGTFVVRDATATVKNIFMNVGVRGVSGESYFASSGGLVRFEGDSPLLTVTAACRSYAGSGSVSGGRFEFKVPSDGYLQTPFVMTSSNGNDAFCGNSVKYPNAVPIFVAVADDSPIYGSGGKFDCELVKWKVAHTDGAELISLQPLKGATEDSETRKLYITEDYLSLRLKYEGGGGTILMLR